MKGKLAVAIAGWLKKRENREKVKDSARQFKSRIKQDEDVSKTSADKASPGHESTPERAEPRNNPPR